MWFLFLYDSTFIHKLYGEASSHIDCSLASTVLPCVHMHEVGSSMVFSSVSEIII